MAGKNSGRGAVAYLAVASIQRGATLLALPFFAASLAPSEYGQIATLLTIYGLLAMLFSAGLEAPVFRAVFSHKSPERQRECLTSLMTALFLGPLLIGGIGCFAITMGPTVFGVPPGQLGLYVAIAGIFTTATAGPLALLRAKEQFGSYALLSLTYAGVQLALRTALVVVVGIGVRGWLIADLVAAIVVLVLSLRWQRPYLSFFRMRRDDLGDGLRMGLPLVPHFASHWVLNLSDRLVIASFWGPAVVGIYSMGYQMAFVAGMAVTELNRAFMPRYGEALQSSQARDRLSVHASRQILATVALTASASLLGPQVVHLLLPPSYGGAARLIPWVALGFAFFGFYCVPVNLIAIVAGKTEVLWVLTLCAGAANLGANILLVPHFGPIAAAIDTAGGYLVLLALVGLTARHRYPELRLDLRPISRIVPAAMLVAAGGSILSVRGGRAGLVASVVGVALVLLVLAFALRRRPDDVKLPLQPAVDLHA